MMNNKAKVLKYTKLAVFYVFALALAAVICVPFFWMVTTSFKSRGALLSIPVEWIPSEPTLDAYERLFSINGFFGSVYNSFYLAITSTLVRLVCAAMAAFALTKIVFKGRDTLFKVFLTALMIPVQITFIPLFIVMTRLNLVNNLNAFLLLQLFNGFAIFMLRQRMMTINNAYMEAAVIDGANSALIFIRVMLPMCSGTLATLAILSFMDSWNDYLLPLVLLTDKKNYTLPLLLSTLSGQYENQYNLFMAGALLSIIPILIIYICAQKYFKHGLNVGGVKG